MFNVICQESKIASTKFSNLELLFSLDRNFENLVTLRATESILKSCLMQLLTVRQKHGHEIFERIFFLSTILKI